MADTLREHLLEKADELDWDISDDEDGVEFYKFSPAGEDFGFYITGKDIASEVREYANGFDTEEHIKMWIEAKDHGIGGVPNIKVLVQDADDIQEMLDNLADALEEAESEYGYEGETEDDD